MSGLSKLRLAALHVVGGEAAEFVKTLRHLDFVMMESSMPNHGTMDDYISLVNGLKSSYTKGNKDDDSHLMPF
jgi:hypothetical protein